MSATVDGRHVHALCRLRRGVRRFRIPARRPVVAGAGVRRACMTLEKAPKEAAEAAKAKLEEAGAKATVK